MAQADLRNVAYDLEQTIMRDPMSGKARHVKKLTLRQVIGRIERIGGVYKRTGAEESSPELNESTGLYDGDDEDFHDDTKLRGRGVTRKRKLWGSDEGQGDEDGDAGRGEEPEYSSDDHELSSSESTDDSEDPNDPDYNLDQEKLERRNGGKVTPRSVSKSPWNAIRTPRSTPKSTTKVRPAQPFRSLQRNHIRPSIDQIFDTPQQSVGKRRTWDNVSTNRQRTQGQKDSKKAMPFVKIEEESTDEDHTEAETENEDLPAYEKRIGRRLTLEEKKTRLSAFAELADSLTRKAKEVVDLAINHEKAPEDGVKNLRVSILLREISVFTTSSRMIPKTYSDSEYGRANLRTKELLEGSDKNHSMCSRWLL